MKSESGFSVAMASQRFKKIHIMNFSQLPSNKEMVFTVLEEFKEGVHVMFYNMPKGDDQKFFVNKDGTLSPMKAPNLVIGMKANDGSAYE